MIGRPAVLGAAIVAAGLIVGLLIHGALTWQGKPRPATASLDGREKCLQEAQQFQAYPLVYLGGEFGGLPLTFCRRELTSPEYDPDGSVVIPAMDSFTFIYGDCTIPEDAEACTAPLQVTVDPPCGPRLSDAMKMEALTIRGAQGFIKLDGSLRIESSHLMVSVFASGSSFDDRRGKAVAAANALVGANLSASPIQSDSPLTVALPQSSAC